jgi:hypothetical protein
MPNKKTMKGKKNLIYLLTKLVIKKDEKGFDVTECRLVDDTL